ncbi:MAG TPA: hypothetical protein VK427_05490 [Kofleriaceae bacterium]|nr:hypothetical protein [Kofleriaceae bacterium]
MIRLLTFVSVLTACGTGPHGPGGDDASITEDSGASSGTDGHPGTDSGPGGDAPVGVITGGPCLSGQPGKTAYRVRWAKAGATAFVVYEGNGLPDKSRDKTGAYGYQIGFTPLYVDPFLGDGGLQLDGSDFVDIELSTVGVTSIASAKLAIYGRSFNTTASGSFNWQTFEGTGSTPTNFVSNVAPYAWYAADVTGELSPGDDGVLLRIKAGPSSGSLVVHRIELCVEAS